MEARNFSLENVAVSVSTAGETAARLEEYFRANPVRTRDFRSRSPPAEFGRFNTGVVNLGTLAGGNAVHGAAFEFVRHAGLNARNYFQSTMPQ